MEAHSRQKELHMQTLEVGVGVTQCERLAWPHTVRHWRAPEDGVGEIGKAEHGGDLRSNKEPVKSWKWVGC